MSTTFCNEALHVHESAKSKAMDSYPIGHPMRYTIWQQYNIEVVDGESICLNVDTMYLIAAGLKHNGCTLMEEYVFEGGCKGFRKQALIYALIALRDQPIPNVELPGEKVAKAMMAAFAEEEEEEEREAFLACPPSDVMAGIEKLVRFLQNHEVVYIV